MKTTQKACTIATSQPSRSMATLLNQMADLQRGARIKELRKARHLTQPALADLVGVTLRALQAWEAGGGITWDNVKHLATKLDADPDFILNGPRSETPELFPVSQLDRIERKIDEVLAWITEQSGEELERDLQDDVPRGDKHSDSTGATGVARDDQAELG